MSTFGCDRLTALQLQWVFTSTHHSFRRRLVVKRLTVTHCNPVFTVFSDLERANTTVDSAVMDFCLFFEEYPVQPGDRMVRCYPFANKYILKLVLENGVK